MSFVTRPEYYWENIELHLTTVPSTAAEVAERCGCTVSRVRQALSCAAYRGLLRESFKRERGKSLCLYAIRSLEEEA